MQYLYQWTKRTQETLAHRSLQKKTFNCLYNLMRTKRLVEVALDKVLSNEGAKTGGVDGVTKADLETVEARNRLVNELHRELCDKTYAPMPVRRTYIEKPDGGMRPLGIPTIRDRVVQEMLRLILEPIYEAHFYPHSYGFRPFRSTHHAAMRVKDLIGNKGYTWAIEGDIRKCFDKVQHDKLLKILRRTIKDERIIRLLRDMLKAGVMEDEAWYITEDGTPQGGIVSPLLANIYLNELDWFIAAQWDLFSPAERLRRKRRGSKYHRCYIVRYADDFVVLVRETEEEAEELKTIIATFLKEELGLELSEKKTLITDVTKGIDFLGFNIRKYKRSTLVTPSRKAMSRFRAKVKERVWEGFSTDTDAGAIEHLNQYIIGWAMYYRRVSSKKHFSLGDHYVWWRVWKTSHRLRNPRYPSRKHYRSHYIPYRYDMRQKNRWRGGSNYGVWMDEARTRALIVVRMSFIPIRYVRQFPQLNPYVPAERARLERQVGQLEPPPDQLPGAVYNPEYGVEWDTLRRDVLERAGYRCWQCQRPVKGRTAHVHHRQKRKGFKNRKQANLLDNLVPLCPVCHKIADRQNEQL
jgi:RNA-directed DNA polymerase